jgi:hypothetical protein
MSGHKAIAIKKFLVHHHASILDDGIFFRCNMSIIVSHGWEKNIRNATLNNGKISRFNKLA